MGFDEILELLDLTGADVGGDVDLLPFLHQASDDHQSGGFGQAPDLIQGVLRVVGASRQEDTDEDGIFAFFERAGVGEVGQGGRNPRGIR